MNWLEKSHARRIYEQEFPLGSCPGKVGDIVFKENPYMVFRNREQAQATITSMVQAKFLSSEVANDILGSYKDVPATVTRGTVMTAVVRRIGLWGLWRLAFKLTLANIKDRLRGC